MLTLTIHRSPTLSSALMQLIPILDGANYTNWACSMEAFLRSQQLWRMAQGFVLYPVDPAISAAQQAGTQVPAPTDKYVKLGEE